MTPGCEDALCQAYRQQLRCYAEALRLAQDVTAALRQGIGTEPELHALAAHLQQVAQIDVALAAPKQTWLASGKQASPPLRELLHQVEAHIRDLLGRLEDMEAEARRQKLSLLPELAHASQNRRMLQAYSSSQDLT